MPLSKSSFLPYLQCPAWFWFAQHKPEVLKAAPMNDFEQMLADQGKYVETEVYKLYPETVRVKARGMEAVQETNEHIQQGIRYIAQAAFATADFFAQADLVHMNENGSLVVYEIKSSSSMVYTGLDEGPESQANQDHVTDLAFQYNVITEAGYTIEQLYLIKLNKDYRLHGELELTGLFAIKDVTKEVLNRAESLRQEMKDALLAIKSTEEPITCDCKYKSRKNQCPAFAHLHPELMDYGVYDLARIGSSKKTLRSMIDAGIYKITDIPNDYKLSDGQRDQVNAWNHNSITVRRSEIASLLNNLFFPLYFLDYETTSTAIPVYEGIKPYEHVPFQYSLHIVQGVGEEIVHIGYLHRDREHPILSLSIQLRNDIGNAGTIIVWNKSFESKCNQNMASVATDLSDFLLGLNGRIFDLMEIFSKRLYVHKDFKGSSSIKKVLPVLVPELSYNDLTISDGGTATTQWSRMVFEVEDESEKEKIYQNLWDYCRLDTLAMVEIYLFLLEAIKNE